MSTQKIVAAGYHMAKVAAYGWKVTKSGDLEPAIKFITESKEVVYWRGSFKGNGRRITIKALVNCGLRNTARLADFALGPPSDLLDMEKPVSITVIHEEGNDGKMYAKVQWVNDHDGGSIKDAIEPERAADLLAHLDLEADIHAEIDSRKPNPVLQQSRSGAPNSYDPNAGRYQDVPF